jgi:predicted transglutaminase-like cysteine proteinase
MRIAALGSLKLIGFAVGVLVALTAATAYASAPARPSNGMAAAAPGAASGDFMVLGAQAPAPLGYLRLCARRPDQCGLNQDLTETGAAADAEGRVKDLYARYFWRLVFQGPSDIRLVPTSGKTDPRGATDWLRIFSSTADAMPASPITNVQNFAPTMLSGRNADGAAADAPEHPAATEPAAASPPLATTPALLSMLDGVNLRVNRAIRYVPDSLSSQVQPWRKVRYTWIERQAPGQQLDWVKIGGMWNAI